MLAAGSATQTKWLFAVGALAALGIGAGWNGLFTFALIRSHPQAPARASGVTLVGGRLGGVAGPFVIGVIGERVSYAAAWVVAGSAGLVAAIALLIGRRMLRASRRQAPG